jgi:hypothetical protein
MITLFENANVLDVVAGTIQPGRNVVVEGSTIRDVNAGKIVSVMSNGST